MIAVNVCGGLGNQLFQYAAARRLALARKTRVAIDGSWYRSVVPGVTPRALELFRYPIDAIQFSRRRERLARVLQSRLGPWLCKPLGFDVVLRERGAGYDSRIELASSRSYLIGYWQSYRYFHEIRDLLKQEIDISRHLSESNAQLCRQMRECDSVFLHVRRGDYVSLPSAASAHGVCSAAYYRSAVEMVRAEIANPVVYVFSDDIRWAKQNLWLPVKHCFVSDERPGRSQDDLHLMSCCRHGILANSSFSWWGAYLSRHDRGLFIAPRNGFHVARKNTDLYPPGWRNL